MSGKAATFAAWLGLREAADAAARSTQLVGPVRRHLAGRGRAVVHDLGAGTGSMGRWLAPRLPVPQHWVLYDKDPDLLRRATAALTTVTAGAAPVTVQARQCDIAQLTATDLGGASLVTASALLDILTADEVDRVAAACTEVGCPVLVALSVTGRVELSPADPLDAEVMAAFNEHQRRTVGGRRLLGPDAVEACIAAFRRHGAGVQMRSSPWRLGPGQSDLLAEWFTGWIAAACQRRPDLDGPVTGYARRRLAAAADGRLRVVVHHTDLLAGCG